MKCGVVQCGAVQCGALYVVQCMWCSICGAVQCGAVYVVQCMWCSAMWCSVCGAIHGSMVQGAKVGRTNTWTIHQVELIMRED